METAIQGMGINLQKIREIPKGDLETIITKLKGDGLTLCHDAGSGHPGGFLSMIRPFFMYYRVIDDGERPSPHMSTGHLVLCQYAVGHRYGNITDAEMANFRSEMLSGHSDTRVQPVASGLLGQGAGVNNGRARAERERGTNRMVYSFHGDGEIDEGAFWESIETAASEHLRTCYVIIHNGKNLSGPLRHDFEKKIKAMKAFGVNVIRSDSTIDSLEAAYTSVEAYRDGPVALVVDTTKGEGVLYMQNDPSGWHGSAINDEQYAQAMQELGLQPFTFRNESSRIQVIRDSRVEGAVARLKERGIGVRMDATRSANAYLANLGDSDTKLFVLIPDIGKSVETHDFAKAHHNRHIDVGIKEMTATLEAMGLASEGFHPVVSTFDGFSFIPFPAVRLADYSNIPFLGMVFTHSELIGEDGPSHLMTENLGAWMGLYNIKTIANPVDLADAKQSLEYCTVRGGIFYSRLRRPKEANIYGQGVALPKPGEVSVIMKGDSTGPTIIATGQGVYQSLIAAEMLKMDGINTTVLSVGYFKPFDPTKVIPAESAGKYTITVEAHNPEVGLASMVKNCLLGPQGTSVRGVLTIGSTGYVPSASIERQMEIIGMLGEQVYQKARSFMGR